MRARAEGMRVRRKAKCARVSFIVAELGGCKISVKRVSDGVGARDRMKWCGC